MAARPLDKLFFPGTEAEEDLRKVGHLCIGKLPKSRFMFSPFCRAPRLARQRHGRENNRPAEGWRDYAEFNKTVLDCAKRDADSDVSA